MVWSEIVEQKRTGRVGKDGRRRARTKFRVRVCWPGADRITKMDVLAFGRRAEAEVRARTLLAMVEAHDAGQGPDPFLKPDGLDFATLLEGYKAALAAGGLGHKRRQGKPKPEARGGLGEQAALRGHVPATAQPCRLRSRFRRSTFALRNCKGCAAGATRRATCTRRCSGSSAAGSSCNIGGRPTCSPT